MCARGFTLIELLVTLALIGLVASIALPVAELTTLRLKEGELRSALRQIREGLDAHKQAGDEGRIILRAGDSGYPRSLAVLVEGVEDARSPTRARIHFLRRIPRDPFADPDLKPEDTWGKRNYRSPHDRPRAGDDVFDVYSLAPGTGINGVQYREW
ncbi:MAG: type II secretion system protein [Pseudomonadota bacterium]